MGEKYTQRNSVFSFADAKENFTHIFNPSCTHRYSLFEFAILGKYLFK